MWPQSNGLGQPPPQIQINTEQPFLLEWLCEIQKIREHFQTQNESGY
jgi:hypothetical protein